MKKKDHMPAVAQSSRTSLGMVIFVIFSILCIGGLYVPEAADAAISVLNQFGDTGQPCVGSTGSTTSNITCTSPTITSGSNRVLVLVITGEAGGNHTSVTVSANFGTGRDFVEVQNSYGASDNRRYAWIGYIDEAKIAGGVSAGSDIAVTVTSDQTWAGIEAHFAVYGGVDQGGGTSTVPGSTKADSPNSTTSIAMGPITSVAGGAAIYASSENATAGNGSFPTNYTLNVNSADSTGNYVMNIGSRVTTPGTTESVSYTSSNARWCAVFMALAPAPAGSPGSIQLSASTYSVNENGGLVTITATRTGGSTGGVGISYATANGTATAGSDYSAASGTLSWTDGDTSDKTFTVSITEDGSAEGDETFTATLSSPTGGAALGSPASATVTILDNDAAGPGTIQFNASAYTVDESAGTITITATRTGGTTGAVGISYATADGTAIQPGDYTSASGTLSWADGDAADKTFTVGIVDDPSAETSETLMVSLSSPTGGASLGSPSSSTVTITYNDGGSPPVPVPAGNWPLLGMVMAGIIAYGLMWRRKRGATS